MTVTFYGVNWTVIKLSKICSLSVIGGNTGFKALLFLFDCLLLTIRQQKFFSVFHLLVASINQ